MKKQLFFLAIILFTSNASAQYIKKVPAKCLKEYDNRKIITKSGANFWWHLSTETDLLGYRVQGAFVKADNDTILFLKCILSDKFIKTLSDGEPPPSAKGSFIIDQNTPLQITFSGNYSTSLNTIYTVTTHKDKTNNYSKRLEGAAFLPSGYELRLFYPMDTETLQAFQTRDLIRIELGYALNKKKNRIISNIDEKPKTRIKKLANAITR